MIAQNVERVRLQIAEALRRSGRQSEEGCLIAVSKTVSEAQILQAVDAGIMDFGENKAQEARIKIPALDSFRLRWHMVGHLQRNKVKYIYDLVDRVHSLDTVELAKEIHRESEKKGRVMPVLVQVNISGDVAKYGVVPSRLEGLLKGLSNFDGIKIDGLMTVVPYHTDPEKSRVHYARLRELRDRILALNIERVDMKELSMGMTNDFHIAVEEGATIVRVGTGIFGSRSKQG